MECPRAGGNQGWSDRMKGRKQPAERHRQNHVIGVLNLGQRVAEIVSRGERKYPEKAKRRSWSAVRRNRSNGEGYDEKGEQI